MLIIAIKATMATKLPKTKGLRSSVTQQQLVYQLMKHNQQFKKAKFRDFKEIKKASGLIR